MAMRVLLTVLFVIVVSGVQAQVNPAVANRMHLKLSGNVPHPVSNKAFRRSFTGIYDISLAYKIRVFSDFSIGLQGKHVVWRTPDNKIPGLDTYGQFNGAGFSISYDRPIGETAVMYATVTAGGAQMNFTGLSYDSVPDNFQTKYKMNYGEIEVGAYFYTEGSFAIGMQTTAIFTNYSFDPYKLALDEHKAYIASDLNGKLVQINLGFSVVYSFLRKRGI